MRIAFFTLGTRGDIEPLSALAKGFADAGHDVRFISDESAKTLVPSQGIGAHFLSGNLQERLTARGSYGRDLYRVGRALAGAYADVISQWALEAAEAAQGCNLVIMSNSSFGIGYAIAERIRAMPCEASVLPTAASRYLPSAALPWPAAPLPGSVKRLLHEAAVRVMWLATRDVANMARRALKLDEISWPFGRGRSSLLKAIPQLYGFSPTLVPRPPDWPPNIAITGFWHHAPKVGWPPPPALAAFLEAGAPPIYVGFGSMPDHNPMQTWDIVLRSIRELGLRAVVAKGWGAMTAARTTDDIFVLDDVPHAWLFPKVSAVVCHGGPGTVGAILRAGVPAVIVPYIVDQPFWGWALERSGVAPRMIPRRRLSVGRLTAALHRATTDDSMRRRAKEVSELVRAEDGVRRAVEFAETFLSPTLVAATARSRAPAGAAGKAI